MNVFTRSWLRLKVWAVVLRGPVPAPRDCWDRPRSPRFELGPGVHSPEPLPAYVLEQARLLPADCAGDCRAHGIKGNP